MTFNKNHWYDGFIYDRFIAPNLDTSISQVKKIIPPGSDIIDIGCGTGRLLFKLEGHFRNATGIDLSIRNIHTAKSKVLRKGSKSISFVHDDAVNYFASSDFIYDYGVLSYILHEVSFDEACELVSAASAHTRFLIMIDYLVPRRKGFWNYLNEIVEFAAGNEHYTNFRKFINYGGIYSLMSQTGLIIDHEIRDKPVTSHIVLAKK